MGCKRRRPQKSKNGRKKRAPPRYPDDPDSPFGIMAINSAIAAMMWRRRK